MKDKIIEFSEIILFYLVIIAMILIVNKRFVTLNQLNPSGISWASNK